jgi:hypothetical protein
MPLQIPNMMNVYGMLGDSTSKLAEAPYQALKDAYTIKQNEQQMQFNKEKMEQDIKQKRIESKLDFFESMIKGVKTKKDLKQEELDGIVTSMQSDPDLVGILPENFKLYPGKDDKKYGSYIKRYKKGEFPGNPDLEGPTEIDVNENGDVIGYRQIEEGVKIGTIRDFPVGRTTVPKEYMGKGVWKDRSELGVGSKDNPIIINQYSEDEVLSSVEGIIKAGIYDPTTYSTRNNFRARIDNALKSRLTELGQSDKYGQLVQSGKFYKDTVNARAIPMLQTAIAQADEVEQALLQFKGGSKVKSKSAEIALNAKNESLRNPGDEGNIWDKAKSTFDNYILEQKLDPAQVAYEMAVFYYIRESNRALTGSSVTAQSSYDQESRYFARELSIPQIKAILQKSKNTLNNAMKARTQYKNPLGRDESSQKADAILKKHGIK